MRRAVRVRVVAAAGIGLLSGCVLGTMLLDHLLRPKSYGPFEWTATTSTPEELSELDAIAAARHALGAVGVHLEDFVIREDERATGMDSYLVRNAFTKSEGTLDWRSKDGSRRFVAQLRVEDGKVHCLLVVPR